MDDAVAFQEAAKEFWAREDVKTELAEHAARHRIGRTVADCFNVRIAKKQYPGFDPPQGFAISKTAAWRQIRPLLLQHKERLANGRQLPLTNSARLHSAAPKSVPRQRFEALSSEESVFAFPAEAEDSCSWSVGEPGTAGYNPCPRKKKRGSPFCEEHAKKAHRKDEDPIPKVRAPNSSVKAFSRL